MTLGHYEIWHLLVRRLGRLKPRLGNPRHNYDTDTICNYDTDTIRKGRRNLPTRRR